MQLRARQRPESRALFGIPPQMTIPNARQPSDKWPLVAPYTPQATGRDIRWEAIYSFPTPPVPCLQIAVIVINHLLLTMQAQSHHRSCQRKPSFQRQSGCWKVHTKSW